MQEFIREKTPQIIDLCRTHHVRRFSVFGSAVRDDFNSETSDVDIRVEFEPEYFPGYARNLNSLQDALVELLGRKVDVLSGGPIKNKYLRQEIEETQVMLYAA
jgi:predicted nucleotidyltransferase